MHSVFTHAPAVQIRRCMGQQQFVAADPANNIGFKARAAGSQFTYENQLQDELQNYGGSRRSCAQYLRDELHEVRGIGASRRVDSGQGLAG